jgi:5-methylthioadenosine/S-adenosylhomocysteine deaminase
MLIKSGQVLSPEGEWRTLDVRIAGGLLSEMGIDLLPGPEEEVLNAERRLVIPGLINAHAHSNEGFIRGSWDALPLEMWLAYAYPTGSAQAASPRAIYIRTALAALEQLRAGTTCVVDFLYELPNPTLETLEAVIRAYSDAGMRAVVAISMWDQAVIDVMPLDRSRLPALDVEAFHAAPPHRSEWMDLARAAIELAATTKGLVRIGLAIDQPQRCSDDLMTAIGEFAEEHDLPVHTHSLESRLCRYIGLWKFGVSQVQHLERLGLMSPRLSLVHSVWVDDRDIESIARGGASVVHNPVSNLKLGSGIAPVPAFLKAGINVGLGVDGESTNDSRDMFEALKVAALIQRPANPVYRNWLDSGTVFRMATAGSAKTAGLDGEVGEIRLGRRADLVLLDLDDLAMVPLLEPLNQLVFNGAGRAVREVLVDGRLVVANGRVTTFESEGLIEEAAEVATAWAPNRLAAQAEGDRLRSMLDELFDRAWAADVGMDAPDHPRRMS